MRSWRNSLPVLPTTPRFVSYCILNDELGKQTGWEHVISMCARMLCSLQLTTRPERPPLLLVNVAVNHAQRQRLRQTGAQLISVPTLGYNLSNLAWRSFQPQVQRHNREVQRRKKAGQRPKRFETFYKFFIWAIKGPTHLVFVDPDSMIVKNITELLHIYPPFAALNLGVTCHDDLKFTTRARNWLYFNAGVMVFQPGEDTFIGLMETLRLGNFTIQDESGPSDQDPLQCYLWRRGHFLPHPIPNGLNWRDYACQNRVTSTRMVKILHRSGSRMKRALNQLCYDTEPDRFLNEVQRTEADGKCLGRPPPYCVYNSSLDAAPLAPPIPSQEASLRASSLSASHSYMSMYAWVTSVQQTALRISLHKAHT